MASHVSTNMHGNLEGYKRRVLIQFVCVCLWGGGGEGNKLKFVEAVRRRRRKKTEEERGGREEKERGKGRSVA